MALIPNNGGQAPHKGPQGDKSEVSWVERKFGKDVTPTYVLILAVILIVGTLIAAIEAKQTEKLITIFGQALFTLLGFYAGSKKR